ncbi:perlucin-like [Contarinia nasturtii]|uniref:perlucin-like n=1 Tax=Contarinia nasturtii TaxID=265458 RepID=UPI0012D49372|nr:perlucin-like [Contarinia nasturtii]
MKMRPNIISNLLLFALMMPIFGQMFYPKHKSTKKYYLITFKANWFKSLSHCRSIGMNLVSITSKEENDRIAKLIVDAGHETANFWTSGVRIDEVLWEWVGSGKQITFNNWTPGQPDNQNQPYNTNKVETCVNVIGKNSYGDFQAQKWNDENCFTEMYFICEQDLIEYEYCTN